MTHWGPKIEHKATNDNKVSVNGPFIDSAKFTLVEMFLILC